MHHSEQPDDLLGTEDLQLQVMSQRLEKAEEQNLALRTLLMATICYLANGIVKLPDSTICLLCQQGELLISTDITNRRTVLEVHFPDEPT